MFKSVNFIGKWASILKLLPSLHKIIIQVAITEWLRIFEYTLLFLPFYSFCLFLFSSSLFFFSYLKFALFPFLHSSFFLSFIIPSHIFIILFFIVLFVFNSPSLSKFFQQPNFNHCSSTNIIISFSRFNININILVLISRYFNKKCISCKNLSF